MLRIETSLDALRGALPAVRTTDAEVARDHIARVFADHELRPGRGAGAIRFVHQRADLAGLSVSLLRYGSDVEVAAPDLRDFHLFQITLDGAVAITAAGLDVALPPGSMFVMDPGRPYLKRWSADAAQLLVKVPRAVLERRLAEDLGRPDARPVRFASRAVAPSPGTLSLMSLLDFLCRDLADPHGLCAGAAFGRRMEGALLSALLAALPHDGSAALAGPVSAAAPRHVLRAERFMRENAARPIALADIARAAGTSPRALQEGFRRFRGTTPGRHLRDIRLDAAREALSAGSGDGRTVTEVALACGFGHLGRFARAYAERFGESPGRTARRRRGSADDDGA